MSIQSRNLFTQATSRYRDKEWVEGEITFYFNFARNNLNKTEAQAAKACSTRFGIPVRSIQKVMRKHGACLTLKMKERMGLIAQRNMLMKHLYDNYSMAEDELMMLLGDSISKATIRKIIRKR